MGSVLRRCRVDTCTITIVCFRGCGCITRALFVGMSCLRTMLIMRIGGVEEVRRVEGERRFSVSFPWSFRRQDAGSDSGSGSDMDTRQDELD